MDQQKQNSNVSKHSYKFGESSQSPPSTNLTYSNLNNLNISHSIFEQNGVNQIISDPGKYLDLQCMVIDQGNTVMVLKMYEYENALTQRDYNIKSLHTDIMNSQNNIHFLTNQFKDIMEKTKSVKYTCQYLNTSFTDICQCLNKLGNTVDNAKKKQKDVINLVDQTNNTFQEKLLSISDDIDDSLKQICEQKMSIKQELESLKIKYSRDMTVCKSNLEESIKVIENFKTKRNLLMEKLNETNMRLNEEKEMVLSLNENHEIFLKDSEGQNALLINQNKSLNVKYEQILNENRSLEDEISMIRISLNEKNSQLDMQVSVIKEQMELMDKLKISKELNDTLKKEKFLLKEHQEYFENNFARLMEDVSEIKLSYKVIREEHENKFKDMCKNYNSSLKMQEEKLLEKTEKLQLKNAKENEIQTQLIDFKQKADSSNNTILNLQEQLKSNYILIPELQNKIYNLSFNLANTKQRLQDFDQNMTEISKLKNEKNELENQCKEQFKQIEKLRSNNMQYKSKAKQFSEEITKLNLQCSPSKQKNSFLKTPTIKTIENDCRFLGFNNKDIRNMDVSIQSLSDTINQKYNNSSVKRTSSLLSNFKVKKRKTSVDNFSSRMSVVSSKCLQQKIDVCEIENSLNSSFQNISLKHKDSILEMEVNEKNYQNLQNKELALTSLEEKMCDLDDDTKNQVEFMSTVGLNKKFKIPDFLKPLQKKKSNLIINKTVG